MWTGEREGEGRRGGGEREREGEVEEGMCLQRVDMDNTWNRGGSVRDIEGITSITYSNPSSLSGCSFGRAASTRCSRCLSV